VTTDQDEAQLIDRASLAQAIRQVAGSWAWPRRPGEEPRAAASLAVETYVLDQPMRGSAWRGDGAPGLSIDQARRAVRAFAVRAAPDEDVALAAWRAVAEAVASPQPASGQLCENSDRGSEPSGRSCGWCRAPLPPERGPLARWCSPAHKNAAWKARKREAGR